jgi:YHS domain-containing protein
MKIQRQASAPPVLAYGTGACARVVVPATTPSAQDAVAQLPRALQILGIQLREAIADRRAASTGSDRHQRADERVAYLNELYVRLQLRMEVPAEIWLLRGGRAPTRSRQPPDRHPRSRPADHADKTAISTYQGPSSDVVPRVDPTSVHRTVHAIHRSARRIPDMGDKVKDPVCGMEVDLNRPPVTEVYEGRTFHFCSKFCRTTFNADRRRYGHEAAGRAGHDEHAHQ